MFKGFKEFLSRGNIIDLAVAVVIGTAFTALVKSFTDSIITPLLELDRRQPPDQHQRLEDQHRRGRVRQAQFIDLNILLSATVNFVLVAAVVYFVFVLPYNRLRKRGEVEQADDAQIVLLTEIRDLLAQTNGASPSGKHGGVAQVPTPEHGPRADAERLKE